MGFSYGESRSFPDLVTEPLVREPFAIFAHPSHPLTRKTRVDTRMLHGETLLLTEVGCVYRERFERVLAAAGAHPANTVEFSSIEAIKQCVMAGMGLSLLPEVTVRDELARGLLAALPWTEPDFGLVTVMAWHRDKWLSPALRAFIALSREVLATSFAGPESAAASRRVPTRTRTA
jgi:DNA-binding transcriptional LysR family regulator